MSKPYNPLEKTNLGESIAQAILKSPVLPLSETSHLRGAGVYAIYYTGDLAWYKAVADKNKGGTFGQPIYIAKAIPKGGRKGGISDDAAAEGSALRDRLRQHYASVNEASNLNAADFHYQCLVGDDIWIPLGENMLIEQHQPVWNRVVDGFGNKDPGNRRKDQYRSPWDVIHPGRGFAGKLAMNPRTVDQLVADLNTFLLTGKVPKRPKAAATELDDVDHDDV